MLLGSETLHSSCDLCQLLVRQDQFEVELDARLASVARDVTSTATGVAGGSGYILLRWRYLRSEYNASVSTRGTTLQVAAPSQSLPGLSNCSLSYILRILP